MRMIRRLFSLEFVLLPFYTYKLIELFLLRNTNTFLTIVLRIFLTLLILPLIVFTIIILAIFYESVEICVRLKHGERFHAMLDGCDRIWIIENASKNIINAVYAIAPNANPNMPSELHKFFMEKYAVIAQTHHRFTSVIKHCLGLQYYLKVDLDFCACVKYMDDYSTLEEFEALLERYANSKLPKNNTYLWEIYIGRHLVPWYDGVQVYPLLIRYHHSLGDGVSIVTLMTTHLLKDGVDAMRAKCENYKAILKKHASERKVTENYHKRKTYNLVNYLRKKFYYPTLAEPEQPNLLHRDEITGKKHMIFVWEKPEDDFINKVKRIKNHYNAAFADVMSTAISASLCDHFAKFEKTSTENIITMNPYFLMSPDFHKLVRFDKQGIPVTKLGNKFAMGFSKIPIDLEMNARNNNAEKVEENELIRRLRLVQASNDRLKSALDFQFCYWQMRMFAGLPSQIGAMLLLANDSSLSISNVPGNHTSRLTNGCEVRDTFVFGNNYGRVGVTITVFTYDERFRIGLLIDKSSVAARADAQRLGDGIFAYINAMVATLPNDC